MKNFSTSNYLSASSSKVVQKKPSNSVKMICSMMIAMILGTFFMGSAVAATQTKKAEALDWTQYIMCEVLPEPSKELYQYTQTSDFWYETRSKSTMNNNVADVETGLNWILNLFGPGYKTVNENILGYDLNAVQNSDDSSSDTKTDLTYNGGEQVSVFDRFGVSGMTFSSYQGEWKYILVDACSAETEPKDPRAGLYYEDRLEPRSTWEYISTSSDPRTIQFDRGIFVQLWTSSVNVIANAMFWVTKAVVVITIAFIGLSLSNIIEVLGINDLIGGENGIFSALFSGLFEPLIFLAFFATAMKMLYDTFVKRQYRESLINLLRSIVLFVFAFVIAMNPSFWIAIPNNVAIFGQTIILTTMSGKLPNSSGLCTTDIGDYRLGDGKDGTTEERNSLLATASENMRSSISCTFWQAFLFRPWVEGQFGTDWKKLWANDKMPDWVEKDQSAELGNLNAKVVGDAEVPLGNGATINNWAIYQLSTQTNVHAPTVSDESKQGKPSKYTSGVANDWWRIVDALSNYDEETKTADIVTSTGLTGTGTVTTSGQYVFPIANAHRNSTFGYRVHPVTGEKKLHAGNDYSAATGTVLYAVADGTVHRSSSSTGGNILEIKAVDGWTYRYLHLSGYIAPEGSTVKAGQEVAKVGSTGRVTGPHLHFETVSPTGEKIDTNDRLTEMGFNPENGQGAGTAQSSGSATGSSTTIQPYEYGVPKNNPVTSYWDTWVGNNSFNRIWASVSSLIISIIGLSAPLVLSAMAVVYSFGIAVLMSFAPVFLLVGCWAGRGWELFKGWGELVINTTLKRIIIGLLLAISMSFISTAINMIETVGWFQGVIVLLLLSILLLNSREKLVNMLASVKFAATDLSGTANRMSGLAKKHTIGRAQTAAKDSTLMAGSVVAAGYGAKRAGGTFSEGMKQGVKREFKNMTYRKDSLSHARISYEAAKRSSEEYSEAEKIKSGELRCASCKKELSMDDAANGTEIFQGGRTIDGNLICDDCLLDNDLGVTADAIEITYSPKEKENKEKEKKDAEIHYKNAMKATSTFNNVTGQKNNLASRLVKELQDDKIKKNGKQVPMTQKDRQIVLKNLVSNVNYDIENYKQSIKNGNNAIPELPEIVEEYFDKDMISTAWLTEQYDFIRAAFTSAFYAWYQDEQSKNGRDLGMDWNTFYLYVSNELDKKPDDDDKTTNNNNEDNNN